MPFELCPEREEVREAKAREACFRQQFMQRPWGTGHESAHPGHRKESCTFGDTGELEPEKLEFQSWLPCVLCDAEHSACPHLDVSSGRGAVT